MTFAIVGSFMIIAMPKSLYLMLVARVLIGTSHGYAYLTVIVHASEIVTQKLRGLAVAALNFCSISSILVCGALTMSLDHQKHGLGAMQWIGILGAIYAVMGFIFVPIFTRESPVTLIRQKKFDQAVSLMIRLRCESTETWNIRNEYNELKAMVEEDEETSIRIFTDRNTRPLLMVLLLKVGSVLSFNFGVNMIRLNHATMFSSDEGNFAVIVLMSVRMITGMIALFTVDTKGRRPHVLISYGGSSVLLIVMGIVIAFGSGEMSWWFGGLLMLYEIIGGFGIGMIGDVYLSEAFNTTKKPNSIFFTTTVEFVLHAALIGATLNSVSSTKFSWIFLIASGIALLAITVYLRQKLPETAKMSIRQTRNEFLKSGEIVFSGSKMPAQNITFS